jgi:hypothetical protein
MVSMPAVHNPETMPEETAEGTLVWLSSCSPCGWRSPAFDDEYGADMAGLSHDDGGWIDGPEDEGEETTGG